MMLQFDQINSSLDRLITLKRSKLLKKYSAGSLVMEEQLEYYIHNKNSGFGKIFITNLYLFCMLSFIKMFKIIF